MLQDSLLGIKGSKHIVLGDYIRMANHTSYLRLALGIQISFMLNVYPVVYLRDKLVVNLLIKCCVYLTILFSLFHDTSRNKSPANGPFHATRMWATFAAIAQ